MVAPRQFTAPPGEARRLDQFLADQLGAGEQPLTRSQVRRLIDEGEVRVNGDLVKAGTRLREGDRVEVTIAPPRPARAEPQAMELAVLHEDADIIVIDKPAGLVVHPAAGHPDGTLVNALLARCPDLQGVGGELRPGIVHRLDKDTSGVMVATKNDAAHGRLAAHFKSKVARREYLAVVAPPMGRSSGTFATLYGRHPVHRKRFSSKVARGKPAVTHWQIEERFAAGADLVRCRLETGRTHQIRVHFADAGHPLLGDRTYGRRPATSRLAELAAALGRQALHAAVLELEHPTSGERLRFEAPLPADLERLLAGLRELP
ncbi:MAG TPA: RluA family pseudouridine synthase [Kofleriaceae bacterium]|nr:RluA family pseudouridine synthase [Kofleriaceae bacterium]